MNFVYLRSYMLKLFAFYLDSCIVNKGDKFVHALGTWECLEGVPIGSRKFWAVWCRAGLLGRSNRPQAVSCCAGGLTALWRRSNRPRPSEQVLIFAAFPCCIAALVQAECALAQGELAYVQGELCVVFELWFGGLRSLFEHGFVSDVSSCCPCLRGPRLVFFKWSCSSLFFGFRSLVGFSFYLFLFFFFSLVLLHVGVVNALIMGEIEDHVWFEDRWMVASLCDEWLTTLCGLILG
jgi:hypothetical protein